MLWTILISSFALDFVDVPTESQERAIAEVSESALLCNSPSGFEALFHVSGSGEITGAHTSEELSELNEDVFLKCPLDFLLALMAQSEATQASVLNAYFGIRHPPWELGAELRKWKDHEDVGTFVRENSGGYLESEAPTEA